MGLAAKSAGVGLLVSLFAAAGAVLLYGAVPPNPVLDTLLRAPEGAPAGARAGWEMEGGFYWEKCVKDGRGAVSARWDAAGRLQYVAISPGVDCSSVRGAMNGPGLTLRSDGAGGFTRLDVIEPKRGWSADPDGVCASLGRAPLPTALAAMADAGRRARFGPEAETGFSVLAKAAAGPAPRPLGAWAENGNELLCPIDFTP